MIINFKKIIKTKLLIILIITFLGKLNSYSQVVDLGDDSDIIVNTIPKENPFSAMMENNNPILNEIAGGFENSNNLENAMNQSYLDSATLKQTDTFIKYNVNTQKKLNINNINLNGIWILSYKEFYSQRITPIYDLYKQKVCNNDTVIIGSNYLYGTTTCMNNLLFYDSSVVFKKIINLKDGIKNPNKNNINNLNELNDKEWFEYNESTTLNNNFYIALYERTGIEKIPTISIMAEKFGVKIPMVFYVLDTNLICLLSNHNLYYLKKIPNVLKVNFNEDVENTYSKLKWKKDSKGYSTIIGKDINSFNIFLDNESLTSTSKRKRLHIILYPPKVGDNTLFISNIISSETNGYKKLELFSLQEPFNYVQNIYIPIDKLQSNLLHIDFITINDKKYSWGFKYKIIDR